MKISFLPQEKIPENTSITINLFTRVQGDDAKCSIYKIITTLTYSWIL